MDAVQASKAVIRLYPRIYFACHRRHVRDPGSNRVLSSHQVSILDHLDEREVTFISSLAEHMGVTVSTISLALDRLVEQGFARRVPDKADRRRVGVLLTKAGVRIRDSSGPLDPDLVATLVERLSDEERGQAVRGLKLLADAAGRAGLPMRPDKSCGKRTQKNKAAHGRMALTRIRQLTRNERWAA